MTQLVENEELETLSEGVHTAIKEAHRERVKRKDLKDDNQDQDLVGKWKHAIDLVIHRARSQRHYRSHLRVSSTQHMSSVDIFDGSAARRGLQTSISLNDATIDEDLLIISPEVDGRLLDIARAPKE
jgi:5'-nucleotidase